MNPTEKTPLVNKPHDKADSFYERHKLSQVTCLLVLIWLWITLGAALFLAVEHTKLLNSVYVIIQIMTTIGYGDITPKTQFGKYWVSVYALGTILLLGSLITLLIDTLKEAGVAEKAKLAKALQSDPSDPPARSISRRQSDPSISNSPVSKYIPSSSDLYKAIQKDLGVWTRPLKDFIIFYVFLMAGTIFFATYEKCSCSYGVTQISGCNSSSHASCAATGGYTKTWVDSMYMCVITLTTIGFGDYTPESWLGRILWIPWAIFGIVAMTNFATSFGVAFQDYMQRPPPKMPEDVENELAEDLKEKVSRVEFQWHLLKQMGRISSSDADAACTLFEHMAQGKEHLSLKEAAAYLAGIVHGTGDSALV